MFPLQVFLSLLFMRATKINEVIQYSDDTIYEPVVKKRKLDSEVLSIKELFSNLKIQPENIKKDPDVDVLSESKFTHMTHLIFDATLNHDQKFHLWASYTTLKNFDFCQKIFYLQRNDSSKTECGEKCIIETKSLPFSHKMLFEKRITNGHLEGLLSEEPNLDQIIRAELYIDDPESHHSFAIFSLNTEYPNIPFLTCGKLIVRKIDPVGQERCKASQSNYSHCAHSSENLDSCKFHRIQFDNFTHKPYGSSETLTDIRSQVFSREIPICVKTSYKNDNDVNISEFMTFQSERNHNMDEIGQIDASGGISSATNKTSVKNSQDYLIFSGKKTNQFRYGNFSKNHGSFKKNNPFSFESSKYSKKVSNSNFARSHVDCRSRYKYIAENPFEYRSSKEETMDSEQILNQEEMLRDKKVQKIPPCYISSKNSERIPGLLATLPVVESLNMWENSTNPQFYQKFSNETKVSSKSNWMEKFGHHDSPCLSLSKSETQRKIENKHCVFKSQSNKCEFTDHFSAQIKETHFIQDRYLKTSRFSYKSTTPKLSFPKKSTFIISKYKIDRTNKK